MASAWRRVSSSSSRWRLSKRSRCANWMAISRSGTFTERRIMISSTSSAAFCKRTARSTRSVCLAGDALEELEPREHLTHSLRIAVSIRSCSSSADSSRPGVGGGKSGSVSIKFATAHGRSSPRASMPSLKSASVASISFSTSCHSSSRMICSRVRSSAIAASTATRVRLRGNPSRAPHTPGETVSMALEPSWLRNQIRGVASSINRFATIRIFLLRS